MDFFDNLDDLDEFEDEFTDEYDDEDEYESEDEYEDEYVYDEDYDNEEASEYDDEYADYDDSEKYVIDLECVYDKEMFHDEIENVIDDLPYDYGRNLDALYDYLTDGFKKIIIFKNCDKARLSIGDYINSLQRMAKDLEEEYPEIKIRLIP